MPDIIITPSTGKLEFVDNSSQNIRKHAFSMDDDDGIKIDAPFRASSVRAPLNIINVNVDNSNTNYPFVLASGSAETGIKTLMMDGSGGTYNPFTNTATIDISGNSATTTLASNSTNLGGVAAASYVTLTGTQTLTNKTITGTFTGNLTGTGSWATNAVNANTATNSTQLNGQSDSYYTNIPARLGYTPVNKAGDTVTGNLIINGNFTVNGATTLFSASNVYISSSQLYIEDNILTLNAFSPYLRYAGVEMYDSGSGTLSSLLWDGEADYFFLTGSSVNGKIITGPDGQTNLTANYVPKATAGYKLGNSLIYDNGTNVGIGTTSPAYKLEVYSGAKTSAFTGLSISNFNNYDGTAASLVTSQLRFAILENDTGTYNAPARTFAILESGNEANNSSSDGFFAISTRFNAVVAQKFRITAAGNVGIGTTSPTALLELSSSTAASLLNVKGAGGNGILFVSGSGAVGIGTTSLTDGARLTILGETRIASSAAYTTHLNYLNGGNNIISSANGGSTVFRGSSNNITAMTILGSGLVGIGTSSPSYKLHVNGGPTEVGGQVVAAFEKQSSTDGKIATFVNTTGSGYTSYIYIGSNPGRDWKIGKNVLNSGTTGHFQITNDLNQLKMQINASDDTITFPSASVGIGTTSPSYKLDVGAAGNDVVSVRLTPGYERVRYYGFDLLGYNDGNLWMIGNNPTNTLVLGKTWDWDNQIGIAYTPGTVGNSGGILQIGQISKNNANYTHGITRLYTNGLERITIIANGNVGISTTLPTTPLHVVGVISGSSFTGAGTGLTGTAAGLSIGGNAATATTASYSLNTTLTTAATYPITSSWATNAVTALNGGVTSISAGTGIGTSAGTGAVTITNSSPNATHTGDVTGATSLTIANDAVTTVKILNANVTNAKLANSSVTIGSTAVSLGATVTTFAGLTSVTSTTFVGALTGNVTGNVTGTAGSETFATVTGRGASTTTQISVGTAAGGSMYTGIKSGAGYSDAVSGATFKSITDHPTGGSYAFASYYSGSTGINSFFVAADGTGYFKGNVGIGTTNPGYKLDVNGNSAFRDTVNFGPSVGLISWGSMGGGTGFGIRGESGRGFSLGANGSWDYLVINTSGNVGIGTTSPIAKLEAYGGSMDPTLTPGDPSIFSVNSLGVQLAVGRMVTSPFSVWLQGKHATVGGGLTYPIVLNPLGGNVGIGTTSPSARLHVFDTNNSPATGNLLVTSTGGNASIRIDSNSTANYTYFTLSQGGVGKVEMGIVPTSSDFYINPTVQSGPTGAAIYIKKADGNVGIGSTSPGYKLDVVGDINFSSTLKLGGVDVISNSSSDVYINGRVIRNASTSTQDGMYIGYNSGGTTNAHIRFYANAGNERMRIQANDGNVGIGTTSAGKKLDVEGIVRTRGASGTGGFEIGAATTGAAKWRIEWDSASDSLDFNWVG